MQQMRPGKKGLKSYADMTIYTINPAGLVPTLCPATFDTSLPFAVRSQRSPLLAARPMCLHSVLLAKKNFVDLIAYWLQLF